MKHIVKGDEPKSFQDWKALENEDWKPSYDLLQNPQKQDLHRSLFNEQGHVCCYCGREITLATSHIEHFRPQHAFESLELDYQNLHASCIRECNPEMPLHCGHHKGEWFDEDAAISPLDPGCEHRFSYTLDGYISTTDAADSPASTMIEKLKLDITYLKDRREETLKGVFDDDFLLTSTEQELIRIAIEFRAMNNGRYTPFGQVVARYAEQLRADA
jgi:uncharacterized protein (TIGR02646 family)